MKSISSATTLLLCLLTAVAAQATTVVDFTRISIATTYNARTVSSSSSTQYKWDFSDSVVLMEDTSGTVGNSNVKFYGGAIFTAASFSAAPNFRILTNSTNIQAQMNTAGSTVTRNITGMYVWNKADFLNGGDSQTVSFSSGASMSFTFPSAIGTTSRDLKFVVKQDGNYYVSQTSFTSNAAGTYSFDPTTSDWGVINTADYSIGSYSALAVTNLQAAGLYFSASSNVSGTQVNLVISDFQVAGTVTAVPEPSTYAAIAGVLALGLVAYRRRRSRGDFAV